MKLPRLLLAAALLCVASATLAQDKTLRIVLGFPPGAALDTLSRLLAERMRPLLGQTIVVENNPGADGNLGVETDKAAAPDGGTVLITPVANMAIFPHSRNRYSCCASSNCFCSARQSASNAWAGGFSGATARIWRSSWAASSWRDCW